MEGLKSYAKRLRIDFEMTHLEISLYNSCCYKHYLNSILVLLMPYILLSYTIVFNSLLCRKFMYS